MPSLIFLYYHLLFVQGAEHIGYSILTSIGQLTATLWLVLLNLRYFTSKPLHNTSMHCGLILLLFKIIIVTVSLAAAKWETLFSQQAYKELSHCFILEWVPRLDQQPPRLLNGFPVVTNQINVTSSLKKPVNICFQFHGRES